jgi:hypothetical protein
MAVHAKIINWHIDSWRAVHKCIDGHIWVLAITLSKGSYWWEVSRGGPRFYSKAEVMGTGSSKTLRAAKLMAIHRMHQGVVDFVPELSSGRSTVHDAIDRAFASSPEAR